MRTVKEASQRGISESLINAVIEQVGGGEAESTMEDVVRHGAAMGVPGFTYYKDTVAFFEANREDIVQMVKNMASDLGESTALSLVMGFRCFSSYGKEEIEPSAARCLYGNITDEDTQVANALAWFALEEVARALCDE